MTPPLPTLEINREAIHSTFSTASSGFAYHWRDLHRQAVKDFRARGWNCLLWLLAFVWLVALFVSFAVLIATGVGSLGNQGACLPDGRFAIDPSTYRYFSGSGFFEITLGFGSMNFTQVKAIDVSWDILVGRGGQAIVAYISWCVFAKYVTTSMEITPITFGTYRTIFLPNGSLILGIPRLIRDFSSRHALHSKLAMSFIIFTMAFTLSFPTFASALAGYSGNVEPFVNITDSNYVPFSSFGIVQFVIHDGWRIEIDGDRLEGNHIITDAIPPGYGSYGYYATEQPILDQGTPKHGRCAIYYDVSYGSPEECHLQLNVTDYVRQYGLYGTNKTNSTFMGNPLESPVLNISTFYLPNFIRRSIFPSYEPESRFSNESLIRWEYDNSTWTKDELQDRGKCQAVLDYQWGFSFIQLFIMIIILLIWTVGIYIMWLKSNSTMKRRGTTEVAGENRAVFELADAMRDQIGDKVKEEGDEVSAMTEANLRRRIRKDLRGGSIAYTTPLLVNGESIEDWTLRSWFKRHKWSIASMIVCLGLAGLTLGLSFLPLIFLFLLPLECFMAIYIGSTRKSRLVIFFWAFLTLTIVSQSAVA